MARWNIVTIVAGIDFSQCRAVILDGGRFATNYAGSVALAADGTPHTQRVNRGVKGIAFGVRMEFAEAEALDDMRAAIQTAEGLAQAVRIQLQDALLTLDVWAIPDYNQETWFSSGPESEGIVQDVVLRFMAVAPHA